MSDERAQGKSEEEAMTSVPLGRRLEAVKPSQFSDTKYNTIIL